MYAHGEGFGPFCFGPVVTTFGVFFVGGPGPGTKPPLPLPSKFRGVTCLKLLVCVDARFVAELRSFFFLAIRLRKEAEISK